MLDLWLTPWRTSLAMTAATLDSCLALQKSLLGLSGVRSSEGFNELKMREAFQTAADANIRRWSDAAGTLQNLPDWYHAAARLPGTALTDYFDAANRRRA